MLTTNDNSVYIFDKKSTVINMIANGQCSVINTKLPQMQVWNSGGNMIKTIDNSAGPVMPASNTPTVANNGASDTNGFVS